MFVLFKTENLLVEWYGIGTVLKKPQEDKNMFFVLYFQLDTMLMLHK